MKSAKKKKLKKAGLKVGSVKEFLNLSDAEVSLLEAGDTGISLDLICRVLFSLGVNDKEIGKFLLGKKAY